MNLAEQLRNEVNIKKDLPWLEKEVVSDIRARGKFSIICDTHVRGISKGFSMPYKYWSPVEEWARKEGFCVSCEYNGYGVKHLVITL